MGLDIYKCKLDKEGGEVITLYKDDTNKSKLALFEKYADHVEDAVEEFYDFDTAFQLIGEKREEWKLMSFAYSDDDKATIAFNKIGTEDRILFDEKDVQRYNESVKLLRYSGVGYQRKQMKESFYTQVLSGCWYVSEDTDRHEDDSIDFVLTQEVLEQVKIHCESSATMLEWELGEDEFVYFSY